MTLDMRTRIVRRDWDGIERKTATDAGGGGSPPGSVVRFDPRIPGEGQRG